MKQIIIIIAGLIAASIRLAAQEVIRGTVTDSNRQPIEAVTVVLQAPDSTFIDGTVTDSTGSFLFRQGIKPCRLIFQHLLYKSLVKEYDATGDIRAVMLESQDYALNEVVVSAERPLVKVENGTLNYDLEALAEKTTAGNAYEAITRLPGVLEQGGSLNLIGAGSVTVILNGRPSSMTSEQLAGLLKSTPVSHVEKAEVMYSAPARYRVKGAVINIVLKKQKTDASSIRGEVGAGFTQGSYAQGNGRANLSFTSRKVTADVLYAADYAKRQTGYDFISHHTLDGKVYDIEQYNTGLRKKLTHNIRTALDYQITENDNLNMAYTAAVSPGIRTVENSTGTVSESSNVRKGDEQMHNFNLDYTARWGTNVGVDYTYYAYPSVQAFSNRSELTAQDFLADSRQYINRWNVYAGQTHALPHAWNLNYGIDFTFANEKSSQLYQSPEGDELSALNSDTELDERTYNFYAGLEKAFGEHLSLSLSVAGEYYRLAGYHRWAVYPSMQLSYVPASLHIFQLSFSSDKAYPDYWSMQDATSHLNGYAKVVGNPSLRPSDELHCRPDVRSEKQVYLQPVLHSCQRPVCPAGLPESRRTDHDLPDSELRLRAELRVLGHCPLYGGQRMECPPHAGRLLFQGCMQRLSRHRLRQPRMERNRNAEQHLPAILQTGHQPGGERAVCQPLHPGQLRFVARLESGCRTEMDFCRQESRTPPDGQRPVQQRIARCQGK